MFSLVSRHPKDYSILEGSAEEEKDLTISSQYTRHGSKSMREFLLVILLAISVLLNIVVPFYNFETQTKSPFSKSIYAGLDKTIDVKLTESNETLEDGLWDDERYHQWVGVVALDESFVKDHELMAVEKFPWDSDKYMYYIRGFHSLHCVQVLRQALLLTHHGQPWKRSFEHITHCLNVLREDIICYADDYPAAAGDLTSRGVRQCRDWDQLVKFSKEHSACYKPVPPMPSTLEQYKFCPDGSKPWEKLGY